MSHGPTPVRRLASIAWLTAAAVSGVLAGAAPASAAGRAACTMSTTSLVFGQYVPSRDGPTDFTATITVTCAATGTSSAAVEGTIGLIGSAGPGDRELAAGAHRLRYQLYLDAARTIPWGDGSGGTRTKAISIIASPGHFARQAHTVYGRIRGRQARTMVGNYSAQITAVLHY